jgi:hypothetical protein
MGETEVCSPVQRKGSKVASGQPTSPGARSNPSRAEGPRFDSVPPQPSHAKVGRGSGEEPASLTIVGPSPAE